MVMLRRIVLGLAVACSLVHAATVRLYLKDGNYHNVREYKKIDDRVRYYSTERGEWEEIPASLIDFKRTEEEMTSREAERREEAKIEDAEEQAIRVQEREVSRIPMETGVFRTEGEKLLVLKQAEPKIVNNKRRSILKAMSPIPILSGKSTVELDGVQSGTAVKGNVPSSIYASRPRSGSRSSSSRPLRQHGSYRNGTSSRCRKRS